MALTSSQLSHTKQLPRRLNNFYFQTLIISASSALLKSSERSVAMRCLSGDADAIVDTGLDNNDGDLEPGLLAACRNDPELPAACILTTHRKHLHFVKNYKTLSQYTTKHSALLADFQNYYKQ